MYDVFDVLPRQSILIGLSASARISLSACPSPLSHGHEISVNSNSLNLNPLFLTLSSLPSLLRRSKSSSSSSSSACLQAYLNASSSCPSIPHCSTESSAETNHHQNFSQASSEPHPRSTSSPYSHKKRCTDPNHKIFHVLSYLFSSCSGVRVCLRCLLLPAGSRS